MGSLKVLIIGPCIRKSRGGIATVINGLLNAKDKYGVELVHVKTHVEGSVLQKLHVFLRAVLSVLQARDVNVIHIHVASNASVFRKSIFVYLGVLLRKPIIMHVHGSDFDAYFDKSSALVKKYIVATFSMCSQILVLSDYWKTYFQKNIPHTGIEVLHNGVYADDFKECQTAPLNLSKFLFLGKLCHRKGIYDLLQAINTLINQQQQHELQFFLAGNGDLEQVRKIIKQHNLAQNVQVLGWLTDCQKKEWLNRVDTVLLPSYAEGLPMAILEAMAGGKIIISSYTGGIPDVVGEENGFLIKPGDVESLANHISYVSTHPNEMMAISKTNMMKIAKFYNLSDLNNQLFKHYYDAAQLSFPQDKVEVEVQYVV